MFSLVKSETIEMHSAFKSLFLWICVIDYSNTMSTDVNTTYLISICAPICCTCIIHTPYNTTNHSSLIIVQLRCADCMLRKFVQSAIDEWQLPIYNNTYTYCTYITLFSCSPLILFIFLLPKLNQPNCQVNDVGLLLMSDQRMVAA